MSLHTRDFNVNVDNAMDLLECAVSNREELKKYVIEEYGIKVYEEAMYELNRGFEALEE